jgi:8-oxo-dGTP pyrophosphatase MutT (NUDIX family)
MADETIDKLAWVYLKEGKILCTRSKGKDMFYMPGGKREKGETDAQALARELKEELTIELIPNSMKRVGIFEAQAHGKPEGTIVKLQCYSGDFKGAIKPASEVAEAAWLSYSDRDRVSLVGQLLFDWLKQRNLLK